MAAPKPPQSTGGDDGFPTRQLISLALCRFAEPIAFTSIMSYTYVMVKGFSNIDESNASFYAGLLVSAFAVAEVCTAVLWGSISDRYGRKPIILIGLAGTAVSSLVFGFATNIWVALGARVVGGLLNGNVAVMQTMVAEMCTKPEYEPTIYAMPPFMWSLGAIVGGAMGGYLAEPAKFYPGVFPIDGLFGRYPYLLPNLVAVGYIIIAMIQGYFFMKETNSALQSELPQEESQHSEQADETTPLQSRVRRRSADWELTGGGKRRPSFVAGSMPTISETSFDLRRGSVSTLYDIHSIKPTISEREYATEDDVLARPIKAFNRSVMWWIIAAVIMCYHQMAYASILPVYFLDVPQKLSTIDLTGGLGYTVHDVGSFMSVNGLIALFIQAVIFPIFVGRVGVWRSLVILIILCPTVYVAIPLLSLLPESYVPYGIYTIMFFQNFFLIIIYPCLLISLKNVTPSAQVLGRVNGIAMSACSGARTIAPPLTGIIYSAGGSALAWWSIAAIAVLGAVELFWMSRPEDGANVTVENVFRRGSTAVFDEEREAN